MRLRLATLLTLAGLATAAVPAVLAQPAQKNTTPGKGGAAGAPAAAPPATAPAVAAPGGVITPARMAAHRAAYRLDLDRTRDNAQIVSARGAMLFEILDACDGWATRQRFSLILVDRDGQEIDTTSDYTTFESKDGRQLRFSLTQTSQGAVSQRITGEAELAADGSGRVRYAEPEAKEVPLPPGTMLPTEHTIRALNAAREGQRFLSAPLFDGTETEGAQDTTTVLSAWQPPPGQAGFPMLAELGSARMRVAFFSRSPGDGQADGASIPEYEVSLRYYENGVADELTMDFGDFIVDGRLAELQPVPGGC